MHLTHIGVAALLYGERTALFDVSMRFLALA